MDRCLIYFPKATETKVPSAFGWWLAAAANNGFDAHIRFCEDFCQEDADLVIMRDYNRPVSEYYEQRHRRVVNRWQPMSLCHDKWQTYLALSASGIPTPPTIAKPIDLPYEELSAALGPQFVVKQVDGSQGFNVFLVSNPDEYTAALKSCGATAIAQKYISDSHGRDIRVWVIGDSVAGAVLRHSATSFVSNYSQGGKASPIVLPQEAARLAIEATKSIGLDFAGVDILFNGKGFTVCEVNGNAGFRTLSAVSDIDILHLLFNYLRKQ